jgi:hypothetical protein
MTDHVTPSATYSLHGDGLQLTFAADAGTLALTSEDTPMPGTREFSGEDITIASEEFATLVTVCLLASDRAGLGTFLTLALPAYLPVERSRVKGIAIISRRRNVGHGDEVVGSEVRVLEGTVSA